MNTALQHLSPDLRIDVGRALAERGRSVWDARRLLKPFEGRLVEIVLDDGQFPDATYWAHYKDVVHDPERGFALVVRGLLPRSDRESRLRTGQSKRTTTLPLDLIVAVPRGFEFLWVPKAEWPMPRPFVACGRCGVASNTGRFCRGCGRAVRRGAEARILGEGFYAVQSVLQRRLAAGHPSARPCGCGAALHQDDAHCGKCGAATGGAR